MPKIKGLIVLLISLTVLFFSCEVNPPGYKIYRNDDMLFVFLSMEDSSRIADAAINKLKLNVKIDTGDKIRKRIISLTGDGIIKWLNRGFFFEPIEPDETLKVLGTDRINGYGVIHL